MTPVDDRTLGRWTLARQHLLERVEVDVVDEIEHLVALQAQYSPSPYIALWSRLAGFGRDDLHGALDRDEVVKATLMRGTLHLAVTRRLAAIRVASGSSYYEGTRRQLETQGADIADIRRRVVEAVRRRPHTRQEVTDLVASLLPESCAPLVVERPTAVGGVSVATDLVNLADDGRFGWHGGSRYRVAPESEPVDEREGLRWAVAAYLTAYGPATRADLAQWFGRPAGTFKPALAELDVVELDGGLVDLRDAPRPDDVGPVPVRLLPKWDSLLLAYGKRGRILPRELQPTVVRKNGDVANTFLVDGIVAGTWDAPLKGKAAITLTPLGRLTAKQRRAVEAEAAELLAWLRPDVPDGAVGWA